MSWMAKLYETYEVGIQLDLPASEQPMPISHTLQNAHIKITIDGEGNFKCAEVLEKVQVVLPATEKSAGRSSGEAPHPLADKIQYIAKDYLDYGGKKKGYFDGYFEGLNSWCTSKYSHPKAIAVNKYIEKGKVVDDLVKNKILFVDKQDNLLLSWPEDSEGITPKIFKVLPKDKGKLDQGNALVCWSVELQGDSVSDTWTDNELQKAWVDFELANSDQIGLCFITGKKMPLAFSHPAKLRHTGDKAKLVSSNDMSGFTFRGRFTDSKNSIDKYGAQSVGVSFDVTQKAHNALRWLISRQGFRNSDQVIVAWAISGKEIPKPMEDTWELMGKELQEISVPLSLEENQIDHTVDLGQSFSLALGKYMAGYQAKLKTTDNIIIMGLDSATPGRMAVTYYQEFFPEDYIERVSQWHTDFSWYQRHKVDLAVGKKKAAAKIVWPISAPSPRSIWEAIYGSKLNDSLKKNTVERVLPCIVEACPFPRDLVDKAVRNASNRSAYKSDEQWVWEKNIGIACALYKGYSRRRPKQPKEYIMGLESDNSSRDYLYGRLLAIAERLEDMSLYVAGESRSTTAARLMQRFADRPASTWRNIELALQPYIQRLKNNRAGFLHNIQMLLDDVMNKFTEGEFVNDKPLSGEFLLAFHSQRLELRRKKELKETSENDESKTEGDE
ncbi:CRISPR-associated protein, Csd1 family [hydrothermal vent metagenome]|uniref:CRISPR-associated protein, Csd1 family n=1 Tax=hydrothermal vent metagenome TaxID=652676 RepID=A0A3B0YH69_9ZZZZ